MRKRWKRKKSGSFQSPEMTSPFREIPSRSQICLVRARIHQAQSGHPRTQPNSSSKSPWPITDTIAILLDLSLSPSISLFCLSGETLDGRAQMLFLASKENHAEPETEKKEGGEKSCSGVSSRRVFVSRIVLVVVCQAGVRSGPFRIRSSHRNCARRRCRHSPCRCPSRCRRARRPRTPLQPCNSQSRGCYILEYPT